MLDYDFLDKCKDPGLIRAILAKLKSGQEGHFPDLIKVQQYKSANTIVFECAYTSTMKLLSDCRHLLGLCHPIANMIVSQYS